MIKNASTESKLIDRFAFFGWCTSSRGTNAEEDTTGWRVHADQDQGRPQIGGGQQVGHQVGQQAGGVRGGAYRQCDDLDQPRAVRGHLQRGGDRYEGPQGGQQAGWVGHQQVRHETRQNGRPPDKVSTDGDVPGGEGVCSYDDDPGGDNEDVFDDITLKISFRDKCEQKHSVLEGGGASLVVKYRLHWDQTRVSCCVTFWYSTWCEVHARTDTLVDQPPYLVRRGWG